MEKKNQNRREFLRSAAIAGTSAMVIPAIGHAAGTGKDNANVSSNGLIQSSLIVPKNQGLRISGTFLDEISHDIPHQNWGEKEWDMDFQHMKNIGIDTVIMIRSGYRKFIFPYIGQ